MSGGTAAGATCSAGPARTAQLMTASAHGCPQAVPKAQNSPLYVHRLTTAGHRLAESIQDVVKDGGTARVHHRRELRGHVPEYWRRQHRPVPRLRCIGVCLSMRSHHKGSGAAMSEHRRPAALHPAARLRRTCVLAKSCLKSPDAHPVCPVLPAALSNVDPTQCHFAWHECCLPKVCVPHNHLPTIHYKPHAQATLVPPIPYDPKTCFPLEGYRGWRACLRPSTRRKAVKPSHRMWQLDTHSRQSTLNLHAQAHAVRTCQGRKWLITG